MINQNSIFVFQGTFNPIHNAHIALADYIVEKYNPQKIIFIPAFKPPHKKYNENFSQHRFKMVDIAIKNNKKYEISDIEFKKNTISYTIETIKKLKKFYDIEGKINFIIGSDAFLEIESWYKADELKNLATFFVFKRSKEFNEKDLEFLKKKGYDYIIMHHDFQNISSSEIRENILRKERPEKILPQKVIEYIEKNELYTN